VSKRAALALGYLCWAHPLPGTLGPAVEALLGLRTHKNEELLFTAGEALCFAFGGACASVLVGWGTQLAWLLLRSSLAAPATCVPADPPPQPTHTHTHTQACRWRAATSYAPASAPCPPG
jgi:hypothetical protein